MTRILSTLLTPKQKYFSFGFNDEIKTVIRIEINPDTGADLIEEVILWIVEQFSKESVTDDDA